MDPASPVKKPAACSPSPVAVAVSGGGRSLANLLARQEALGAYKIAGVIASSPNCGAVELARKHSLPLHWENFPSAHGAGEAAQQASPELLAQLEAWQIEWVVLAGFLKVFPSRLGYEGRWQGRVINIHPALLPKFGGPGMYGTRVHAAVLAAGECESGASVHVVSSAYDEGELLARIRVAVAPAATAAELAAKVFAAECQLLPLCLADLVRGLLPLGRGRVYDYTEAALPEQAP